MLKCSFLPCTKAELLDLTVCFVVNREKFPTVTLVLDPTVTNTL